MFLAILDRGIGKSYLKMSRRDVIYAKMIIGWQLNVERKT